MARRIVHAVAVASGLWAWHHLGLTYGSTVEERRRAMPGDDVVRRAGVIATHAATLPAPPERVWPWLQQVGWHRGGWYTPRWVDALLFPANAPSADRLLGLVDLAIGDFVPDGPPETECGFDVVHVEFARSLVLESRTHLPLSWRLRHLAALHWTWSFVLAPVDGGRATRLAFRWRASTSPWWLTAGTHAVIVPADLVMSTGMLRGLSRRVVPRKD